LSPLRLPLAKAVEQADFAGIVRITEVPAAKKEGFRASDPPTIGARLVSVLKGDPKPEIRITWQTYFVKLQDPKTVEVVLPIVGDEYMVFLKRNKDGTWTGLDCWWNYQLMPPVPNVRIQPPEINDNAWRGLIEVSPPVAGPREAVRYRFTRTRLAQEAWTGTESNITAEDIDVVDLTRKQVLVPKKRGVRVSAPAVIEKGQTVVDVIDLTDAFGITKPGEYWVFRGGAFEGNAPLRFEISDNFRRRTDGSGR